MKTVCLLSIAVLLCGMPSGAADIEVVRSGAEKTKLDLSRLSVEGDSGALFKSILQENLRRSGVFDLRAGSDAAIVLAGSYRDDGTRIDVQATARNIAANRTYFTRAYRADTGNARLPAQRLADDLVESVSGVTGLASTRIALIGSVRGVKNLYLCDADGGRFLQVTRENSIALAPSWFPDAASLLYTSFHRGYPDIYAIDLRRNRRESVAAFPGLNVSGAVSPDGTEMAAILSKDGNPELYVISLENRKNVRRLTRTPNAVEASPAWSPNGRQIVFVSDRAGRPQLYIADARSGADVRRLTMAGTENVAPDWGVNNLIAYSSRRGGRYAIFAMDSQTGKERQVSPADADYEEPSWAPNGRHIVCVRRAGYRSEVFIIDTEGDPPIRLTGHREGDWYSPVWSPKPKK